LLFFNIDKPSPEEIKDWMKKNELSINLASETLGISKRQFARFLSGETHAKRIHALAMQMVWLINENKKKLTENETTENKKKRKIKIPIK
jgi:predicted XRE-type DNA-binding protein